MIRLNLQQFAHKKGMGSTRNGRDSESKRLGPKRAVGIGKDDTLFAKVSGVVRFEQRGRDKKQVSVYPVEEAASVQ